jgi:hypothetical protein
MDLNYWHVMHMSRNSPHTHMCEEIEYACSCIAALPLSLSHMSLQFLRTSSFRSGQTKANLGGDVVG